MQRVPPEARRINDIAISGNGEPTSAQEFTNVIDVIARLKPADLKLVLITNGSLMRRASKGRGGGETLLHVVALHEAAVGDEYQLEIGGLESAMTSITFVNSCALVGSPLPEMAMSLMRRACGTRCMNRRAAIMQETA